MSDIDLFPEGKFARPDATDWPPERIVVLDQVEACALDAEAASAELKAASKAVDVAMSEAVRAKKAAAALPKIAFHDLWKAMVQ